MLEMKNVGWAIGTFCNANCKQCYSRDVRTSGQLLSVSDVIQILDKLANLKISTINIGGNEPIFTHGLNAKDSLLPFIIREIKRRGMLLGITTNGTSLLLLHELYPKEFNMVDDWDISLDSPFPDEHNNNRGINLFEIAEKALELAELLNKKHSVIYCLMNWNCSLRHAKALSKITRKYNADLRINLLKPINDSLSKMEPSLEQIQDFFLWLDDFFYVKHSNDIATLTPKSNVVHNCPCGKYSFAISAKKIDGTIPITPCVYMQKMAIGNILEDNLEDLFKTPLFMLYKTHKVDNKSRCYEINCKHVDECSGGCLSYAIMTGQKDAIDPRCPLLNQNDFEYFFDGSVKMNEEHVHSNYLCTWIGENYIEKTKSEKAR